MTIRFRVWVKEKPYKRVSMEGGFEIVDKPGKMLYPEDVIGGPILGNVENYTVGLDGKLYEFVEDYYMCASEVDGEEFEVVAMLSTGFKDKSRREVFDGDVVLSEGGGKLAIEFDNSLGWSIGDSPAAYDNWHYLDPGDIEVVGNIHENPELLEDE